MYSGEEGTAESLLCAACDCHRSFHRKEIDDMFVVKLNTFGRSQRPLVSGHVSPIMMSFGGVGRSRDPAESSTEDLNSFINLLVEMEWISLNTIPRNGLGQSSIKNIKRI
ncbi:unnamed protein product [Eruca vesicaria subsp. sativa]|uniref:ZF-HD dimerization-type domain-containing protein n=1 Tax=Eruca vesicaria subsp. sativa TaxID=29727 RepID=A0ABC8LEB6_ERUVS|nr:unnamed protein product [Eruca vesicaria subsp. sativa]